MINNANDVQFWEDFYDLYHDDPVAFFEDILNFYPDDWQIEATESVRDNPLTSIRSGQGVGKTADVACIIIWFMTFHSNCRIIATAPTRQQLYDVMWSEISKWLSGTILDGIIVWRKTKLEMAGSGETWFATTKTATRPENMQGYHEEYMLFVVDEASGVSDPILEAILGTLGHDNNRLLLLGNPTKNYGIFHDSFTTDRKHYHNITVNALDVKRTNKTTIQMLIDKYGWDSNVVRVRVRGLPPIQSDDVFFSLAKIELAINRLPWEQMVTNIYSIDIGCDVARFGSDETVICTKINHVVLPLFTYKGKDLMKTANTLLRMCREWAMKTNKKVYIDLKIDDSGLGGGVTDRINEVIESDDLNWLNCHPIIFGQIISEKKYGKLAERFYDTTTLMAHYLDEALSEPETDHNERGLLLPNDDELIAQLTVRKYSLPKGRIKLESKDEMKKRGLPSPDRADALFLCIYPAKSGKFKIF